MATRGDSEGFVSTLLEEKGARPKDSYFPLSDENASEFKETYAEFRRLEADFSRITHNRRFQGANPPEAHRQFNDGHNDDQPISQTKSDILPN